MKMTTKLFRTAVILFITALAFTACRTENGKDGIDGLPGQDGQQGPTGNANVVLYTFNAFTGPANPGDYVSKNFALTTADFDKSLIYTYVSFGINWYPIPGYVEGTHSYRTWYRNADANTTLIGITKVTGNAAQNFTGMRIYVVKSNSTIDAGNGRMFSGTTSPDGKFYTDDDLRNMTHQEFCSALGVQF